MKNSNKVIGHHTPKETATFLEYMRKETHLEWVDTSWKNDESDSIEFILNQKEEGEKLSIYLPNNEEGHSSYLVMDEDKNDLFLSETPSKVKDFIVSVHHPIKRIFKILSENNVSAKEFDFFTSASICELIDTLHHKEMPLDYLCGLIQDKDYDVEKDWGNEFHELYGKIENSASKKWILDKDLFLQYVMEKGFFKEVTEYINEERRLQDLLDLFEICELPIGLLRDYENKEGFTTLADVLRPHLDDEVTIHEERINLFQFIETKKKGEINNHLNVRIAEWEEMYIYAHQYHIIKNKSTSKYILTLGDEIYESSEINGLEIILFSHFNELN